MAEQENGVAKTMPRLRRMKFGARGKRQVHRVMDDCEYCAGGGCAVVAQEGVVALMMSERCCIITG